MFIKVIFEYKFDANLNKNTSKIYSMDLQKVLILPTIPATKFSFLSVG